MKFTCESCSAQYMISDEKVGPNGVKVRCKKCGNVILVRRPAEAPSGEASPETSQEAPPAGAPEKGLDAELGKAFDQAFGDTPPSTPAPGAGKDLAATQAMEAEDAAKIFTAAAPAQTEWYVAIGQAQVGPLPLGEVKKKWEGGDVGPDSLVWRPGMGDWAPLSTLPDLAGFLAPIPRAAEKRAAEPASPARKEPEAPAPSAPAADVSWKPVGASALAALASEEIAGRTAPEPSTPRPAPGGVKSLVDALPDGGGVDPTGALPLSIKGLERTDEKKIEPRTSVARGAVQARQRRSASRAVAIGLVVAVVLVGGGGVGAVVLYQRMGGTGLPFLRPAPGADAPAAAPPAAPAPPAAAATPAPGAPAAQASASPPPSPEPAPAAPEPPAEKAAPPPKRAAAPPRETKQAAPRREARAAAPASAPAKKKGESLLDFEANDAALDAALGGGTPSGRSVYVPPAAGGLPDKISPGDINGAVAQRIDALRRCVTEQKAREPDASGTLKMRWVIQADGSVRDVRSLTPEYAKGAFAACISGVVKSIRFPRSTTTGQEVIFPFNF